MKIYQIWYINSYGEKEFVALTDNPEEWIKDNNKRRIDEGNEPELDDFEIHEEQDLSIYNKDSDKQWLDELRRKVYPIMKPYDLKKNKYKTIGYLRTIQKI